MTKGSPCPVCPRAGSLLGTKEDALVKRSMLLAFVISLASLGTVRANDDVSGVMLQGWYWDSPPGEQWWNKLSQMMPQFRQWGLTALWIPPACKGAGGGYSSGYDLYDFYDIGGKDQLGGVPTKWGHKRDLLKMISVAHANGLDVYADIVPNHRSGGSQGGYSYENLVGSEATGRFTMAPWDFHPKDWRGDWYEAVAGLADIAQEVPYVRDGLYSWIRWFDKQTGVDGYRVDAVKHMKPEFTEGLLYQVQEGASGSRSVNTTTGTQAPSAGGSTPTAAARACSTSPSSSSS
jgi:glycosidase